MVAEVKINQHYPRAIVKLANKIVVNVACLTEYQRSQRQAIGLSYPSAILDGQLVLKLSEECAAVKKNEDA